MKMSKTLSDTKVNFVCPRCQQIYYQEDKGTFNSDPKKVAREAKVYKGHYHSCRKRKNNSRKGGKKV